MPRTGKGGARQGGRGVAYANRSDLNTSPLPADAATGQPYGAHAEQVAAQRAVPAGPQPIATAAPSGPGAAPTGPTTFVPPPTPGQTFTRPTERPGEPLTHGLPSGPGAGPEALQGLGAPAAAQLAEQGTLVTLLQHLAAQPGASSAIDALASRAASGAR